MPIPRQLPLAVHGRARLPSKRFDSTYQPPDAPKAVSNPHRDFYRTFGRPIAKNFLIAVFTYQVLYWSWLKLESLEIKDEKQDEIRTLEGELKSLTKDKAAP